MFGYTGLAYDETSDLTYARARYLQSSLGRFISEDTYTGEIADPLSLNRYTYVHINPLRYVDPSGHAKASDNSELAVLVMPYGDM